MKVPRFTFEKFPEADPTLTTQMKSVGEAMAIGRTFKEALQKALRSLEIKRFGLCGDGREVRVDEETLRRKLSVPNAERIFYLAQAFQTGMSIEEVFGLTKIDPWFLSNIAQVVRAAETLQAGRLHDGSGETPELRPQKQPRERMTERSADGDAPRRGRNAGVPPVASSGLPARSFSFHGFDPQGEVEQRRRNLPHFEQPGATYFVSFRLEDSVPQSLLQEWREEKRNWLKHHPPPWDWKTEQEHRRRFVEPREEWLDRGHGSCLLRDPRAARVVAESLGHFHLERYLLDSFVIMPNHVHALVKPLPGHSLTDILQAWKSYSAHELNRTLDRDGEVWMSESHDHIVRDWEELAVLREYIAANPGKGHLGKGEFVFEERKVLVLEDEQSDRPRRPLDTSGGTPELRRFKRLGFSDRQIAHSLGASEEEVRAQRVAAGIIPTYRLVDTCAAEFEAYTPYYYSTYGDENENRTDAKRKIMILGGGPNRIGQGIEFDYCCVHAAFALRELGIETIMVNSNPETVSTDYDTSDKLYFEPLTHEDVLNIYEQEKPEGVIVQFGGQTPLNLAAGLKAAGVPIIGTQPESIELAEDRKLFAEMLDRLGLRQTPSGSATSEEEAVTIAERIGYPVLVRPSFVLGGRAMELVYHPEDLRRYMQSAIEVSPERPVLVDRFLEDAIEVDVDCIADGERAVIGAIMEHIEEAGIHSGDSACVVPTFSLSPAILAEIASATKAMARELNVRGLMNVQFAVKDEKLYVLEVNPRASRTVPFVSKAIGVPLAKLAAKVMTGMSLGELGFVEEIVPPHYSVKEAVFPFLRFEGINISLGPEMKSTGEVMGIDADLGLAYAKSQLASSWPLPRAGNVFISVKDSDKQNVIAAAREYAALGFGIVATEGTAAALAAGGVEVTKVFKIGAGRPNVLDLVKNGQIQFIINTPSGKIPRKDEVKIRIAALGERIPIMSTLRAARASAEGIRSLQKGPMTVKSLQEYHPPRGRS